MLVTTVLANVWVKLRQPGLLASAPVPGLAVWLSIALSSLLRRPNWRVLPAAARGSLFLLSLVLSASLMPVETLPAASWQTALGLGFTSAVFDNIPLTALALVFAIFKLNPAPYAVGFGGSMIWFGSSAGVALASAFAQARSTLAWVRGGWHVAVAYVLGYVVLLLTIGWKVSN